MSEVMIEKVLEKPIQMNLELTTRCPLHCPQCYVSLNNGREMSLDTALYWIRDAASAGVSVVNLSGGETLCYPHLTRLIRECSELGLSSNIALSGAYVTEDKLNELIDAGVTRIFVSLNGSTEEINEKTRDGYELAINTLELLKKIGWKETVINWVMHGCNTDDFTGMIGLAERYRVPYLAVMALKPDSLHQLENYPTKDQIYAVADQIRNYSGDVNILPETCFSQMLTLVKRSFFGSTNYGVFRGCGAGRDAISVTVEGKLTPCRHLEVEEEFDHIMDYWTQSHFLKRLRSAEENRMEPCRSCRWEKNCLPCMAVGMKLHGELRFSMRECPVAELAK